MAGVELRVDRRRDDDSVDLEAGVPPRGAQNRLHALDFGGGLDGKVDEEPLALAVGEESASVLGVAGLAHQRRGSIEVERIVRHPTLQLGVEGHVWRHWRVGRLAGSVKQTVIDRVPIDGVR